MAEGLMPDISPDALLRFCESQRDWLLDVVERLVRLESPTPDKSAVDKCGVELRRLMTEIGGRVQPQPRETAGDHLLAEFGCGTDQILLLGHFDTVWPVGQIAKMPFQLVDGRLHGPGVFDMKAGIAMGLLAVRALLEGETAVQDRVVMLWTSDEETGSATSRALVEEEARRSRAVLVLEPALPGGALKTTRKGCGTFQLIVRGRAAHAGVDPGKGASAIHELAHQILALQALQDLDRGVSVNVGTIAGGSRSNVVADTARAVIDVRAPTRQDAERLEHKFLELRPQTDGTTVEISGGFDRPPFERNAGVIRLYTQACVVARSLGQDLAEGSTGGGSDGNFTAALGVPTLDGLGAVGDGAHANHEHVDVNSLAWRAALVAGLIASLP